MAEQPPRQQEPLDRPTQAQRPAACRIPYRKQILDQPARRMNGKLVAQLLPRRKDGPQRASACRMTYRSLQIPLPDCRTTYKPPFILLQAFALRHLSLGASTQYVDRTYFPAAIFSTSCE